MNKKADGGLTALIIILLIIIFLSGLISINSRECNSNKDCSKDSYCGSDFSCHQFPIIEKTVTISKGSYTLPILIICLTAIILTIILRWEKIFKKQPVKIETETSEPFYASQTKATIK